VPAQSYRRGNGFKKRIAVMNDWASFVTQPGRCRRSQGGETQVRQDGLTALQQQSSPTWAAFMRRMAELGYQEGKTFVFDLVLAASEEDYETGYRTLAAREPDA
jgi:hypothetical protein